MKKIFCIVTILILSIISCQKNNTTNPTVPNDGLTYPDGSMGRATYFADYRKEGDKSYEFYKAAEYDKLIVYVKAGSGYNKENLDYVAKVFNDNYAEEVRIYGEHTDFDNNGKIIILFLELNADYSGPIVVGYFAPKDLLDGYVPDLNTSNKGEFLYMDIANLNSDKINTADTIMHEFQHLINMNVNIISQIQAGNDPKLVDTWFNEGLSESTALLFNRDSLPNRISNFNQMLGYYCFYTWRLPDDTFPNNPNSQYLFANYPSVSVFMNWIYEMNNQNPTVFQNIAKYSPDSSINRVLNNVSFTGASSWDDLLLKWIEGVANGKVEGAEIQPQDENVNIKLYPGAVVAYNGDLAQEGNLVTRKLSSGLELALNKDTTIIPNPNSTEIPPSINITTPQNALSIQASKMYKTVGKNDKPYTPKYKHVYFDMHGNMYQD